MIITNPGVVALRAEIEQLKPNWIGHCTSCCQVAGYATYVEDRHDWIISCLSQCCHLPIAWSWRRLPNPLYEAR